MRRRFSRWSASSGSRRTPVIPSAHRTLACGYCPTPKTGRTVVGGGIVALWTRTRDRAAAPAEDRTAAPADDRTAAPPAERTAAQAERPAAGAGAAAVGARAAGGLFLALARLIRIAAVVLFVLIVLA